MESRKIGFSGMTQTCYSEWSKTVLEYYPQDIKFQYEEDHDVSAVYHGQHRVAEYDFSSGTGYVTESGNKRRIEEVGRTPNFEEFDVDNLIQF